VDFHNRGLRVRGIGIQVKDFSREHKEDHWGTTIFSRNVAMGNVAIVLYGRVWGAAVVTFEGSHSCIG
jgi:hypothetical protein